MTHQLSNLKYLNIHSGVVRASNSRGSSSIGGFSINYYYDVYNHVESNLVPRKVSNMILSHFFVLLIHCFNTIPFPFCKRLLSCQRVPIFQRNPE